MQRSDPNLGQRVTPSFPFGRQDEVDTCLHPSPSSSTPDSWRRGSPCEISADAQEPLSLPQSPDSDMVIGKEVDTVRCHSLGLQLADSLKERLGNGDQVRATAMIGDRRKDWMFQEYYSDNVREYVSAMVSGKVGV